MLTRCKNWCLQISDFKAKMHQIHFLLGPTSKGMDGNGRGEEKVKGKEGERWREGFGPPKNFGVAVAPPMRHR